MFRNLLKKRKRMRQQEEQIHNDTLSSMAVYPASVNVSLLLEQTKQILHAYLLAIYNLDSQLLPMEQMEEQFYYEASRRIHVEKKLLADECIEGRSVDNIMICDLQMKDYDNTLIYAVRSITYSSHVQVDGFYVKPTGPQAFHEVKQVILTFINDSRTGWMLSEAKSL